MLSLLELTVMSHEGNKISITDKIVLEKAQTKTVLFDKDGDQHYDIISAFIKSIRGSDPNAAVYWLARLIEGGEDVKFIARRLLILASEDIEMQIRLHWFWQTILSKQWQQLDTPRLE